jgi:hypothetical protein
MREAFEITTGSQGRKAVLIALAFRACDKCGICWPGVRWIMERTELSERGVQTCLAQLVSVNHIAVRRYSSGGRGVSTEYVVLPDVGELSTAPCGECASRMKNPAGVAGLQPNTPQSVRGDEKPRSGTPPGREKPRSQASESAPKPRSRGSETPQNLTHHQSDIHQSVESTSSVRLGGASQDETGLTASYPSEPHAGIPQASKDALRAMGLLREPTSTPDPPRGQQRKAEATTDPPEE